MARHLTSLANGLRCLSVSPAILDAECDEEAEDEESDQDGDDDGPCWGMCGFARRRACAVAWVRLGAEDASLLRAADDSKKVRDRWHGGSDRDKWRYAEGCEVVKEAWI